MMHHRTTLGWRLCLAGLVAGLWLALPAVRLEGQTQSALPVAPGAAAKALLGSQEDVATGLNSTAAIATGAMHSCALTAEGGVKCWGRNDAGQLGDGTTTDRPIPVDVIGLTSGVTALAAGYAHTCALTTGGGVKCWGNNGAGQLGDGTTTSSLAPVDVSGLASGVALVAGDNHTCAVTTGGGVKCWGDNSAGQLGDGTITHRTTPVDVGGLTGGASALAAGWTHTCALTTGGGVKCWGRNMEGQLGDGTTTNQPTPVDVSGLTSGASALAAGDLHTCVLMSGGGAKCWGLNDQGQLGDGTTKYSSLTPVDVIGLTSGAHAVAAGWRHTCAMTTSGGVKCWGSNSVGQLGDGTTTNQPTPVDVSGLTSGASALAAGFTHTCAVTSSGIQCWGNNVRGQLGDGTRLERHLPVDVVWPGYAIAGQVTDLSGLGLPYVTVSTATSQQAVTDAGGYFVIADVSPGAHTITPARAGYDFAPAARTVYIPSSATGQDFLGTVQIVTASTVTAGERHTCALTGGGGVRCWGANNAGQLGDGTNTDRLTPVDVSGLMSGVIAVAAGGQHTCAVTTGGGVKCWGSNDSGQLGDGSITYRNAPVDVSGLTSGVGALAAGGSHTCAVTNSSGVKCWGDNQHGQLGDGTTNYRLTPVDVSGLTSGVSTLAAGYYHTCALTSSGGAKCWGNNGYGQLGDGTKTRRLRPVDVSGLTGDVSMLTAGLGYHTCAVTASGAVKCWGRNAYGQLGDGTKTDQLIPTGVSGLTSGVRGAAAGGDHTCAVTTGGGAKCWGWNSYGQLGDGTKTQRLAPVDVSAPATSFGTLATGYEYTCAVTGIGGVKCWGWNVNGQLGDGTTMQQLTPVSVVGFVSVALSISGRVTAVGGVGLPGARVSIETGQGTVTNASGVYTITGVLTGTHTLTPSLVGYAFEPATRTVSVPPDATGQDFIGAVQPLDVRRLAAGGVHACAVMPEGGVRCWGAGWDGLMGPTGVSIRPLPVSVDGLTGRVTALAAGQSHTCALLENGGLQCWGGNYHGQLGDGAGNDQPAAVNVSGLTSDVTALAAGLYHTCAVTSGGGVKCWGWNWHGSLGDGTTTERLAPVDVSGLTSGAATLAGGGRHTCAVTTGGAVKCWGDNSYGQLGDGTTTERHTPVQVSGLTSGVIALAAGNEHTCALSRGGGVKCWGYNTDGQLGDGTRISRSAPVDVVGLTTGAVAVVAGYDTTCAVTGSGEVLCWGAKPSVDLSELTSGVVALAAANSHACAMIAGDKVKCWGDNYYGELGDGTTAYRTTLVDVAGFTSAAIAGRVTDASGAGGGGVWVWMDAAEWSVTDADGWYVLPDVSPGAHTLTASLGGYTLAPETRTVSVPPSAPWRDFRAMGGVQDGHRSIDLSISFPRTIAPADRASYEEILGHFADAIYEMSNGAHTIRRVVIFQNGENADKANVRWEANLWPCAAVAGYGTPGWHVWMSDVFGYDLRTAAHRREGGFVLAHEWGHFYYGLYDEYRCDLCGPYSHFPQPADVPVLHSVMNNNWLAARGDYAWGNFSVAKNTWNGQGKTAQDRMYGASGWETLARPVSQDPRGSASIGFPTRSYYEELGARAPAAGEEPSLELTTTPTTVTRSELNIQWMEPAGAILGSAAQTASGVPYRAAVNALGGQDFVYPQPVVLVASVSAVHSIAQAGITASALGPDGAVAGLSLADDGVSPDAAADDGLYSGFMPYHQDGEYLVSATFDNHLGTAEFTEASASHAIGPNGETYVDAPTPVGEDFAQTATARIFIFGVKPDDHGDAPEQATVLVADNVDVAGRIDRPGDVDMFEITPGINGTWVIRLSSLALGMAPSVRVLASDSASVIGIYSFTPQPDTYLFARFLSQPGDRFYVEVSHQDGSATGGTYAISAGAPLPEEAYKTDLPLVVR